jgi:lambda family phage minor tail protein L
MSTPNKLWDLGQDAIVEMYILDASMLEGGTSYHFTLHDMYEQPVVWAGVTYTPYPIFASGFERKANSAMPRPSISISNSGGFIGAICRATDDLIGAKVSRIRTFKKYLDAVNFPGGVNPTANPAIELPREIWHIDRRAAETAEAVTFEMAAPWDVSGVRLPRRIVVQSSCMWPYRSAECGYVGGPVATIGDQPTLDPALDQCGKRVASCKLRFGQYAELPFGGFPSVGQTSARS